MATQTAEQLIDSVREVANQELMSGQDDLEAFVTDPEVLKRINEVRLELYDIMLEVAPYFAVSSGTVTLTTSNTGSLPTGFYRLLGVDYMLSGRLVPLRLFEFASRARYTGGNFAGSYVVWYNPALTPLVALASLGTVEDNYREFIIQGAAAKIMAKAEESDPTSALAEKANQERRVRGAMARRNTEPEQAPDVRFGPTAGDDFDLRRYSLQNDSLVIWSSD